MIIPVIMSGGAGTRLWPLARESGPKPFLPLVDGISTFASTLARVSDRTLFGRRSRRQCRAPPHAEGGDRRGGEQRRLLLEPEPRDTTAAIAAAARSSRQRPGRDPSVPRRRPSGPRHRRFRRTVKAAQPAAVDGAIVTFGVRPTHASESYGYIDRGEPMAGRDGLSAGRGFVEKPDAAKTALRYLGEGHLWNSGNFMMSAATALAELAALRSRHR